MATRGTVASKDLTPALTGHSNAGMINAPWGGQTYPVAIVEVYGKIANVRFEDGYAKWLAVAELQPPQSEGGFINENCPLRAGDKVFARWENGKFYAGLVAEVYGKLVKIDFADGDKGWALALDCHKK